MMAYMRWGMEGDFIPFFNERKGQEMNQQKKSLLSVHMAVVGFGLAGLFAKIVNQPAIVIAWGRVVFSVIFLFILFKARKQSVKLNCRRDYLLLAAAGALLAVHWTTFLQSIQISTVAVGTLTFSTYPLFVTFLEPYIYHERLKRANVVCALVMLIGVILIVPEFHLENSMTQGVIWGMVGSLTYAVLSLMNRSFSDRYTGTLVAFYEQGVAAIVLLPAVLILHPAFTGRDIAGLVILGVAFTAGAHSLFIEGLKHVKVQTAGIISGLESVYGILAALVVLGEVPGFREIIGGLVIMGVVFYSTLASAKG